MPKVTSVTLLAALLLPLVAAFGNEYVHIKVHVPKDQAPSIAIDAEPPGPPHKVIHHFHHHAPPHQRSRGRAPPPKPHTTSPLLESVILSDLDKPLHMSEHADYLNHAKELAEHLSESYAAKKPPPPKKKVNTYTIIEEKHRPNGYEYGPPPPEENSVETYRVINSRPHKHHPQHHQPDDDDNDVGYHYRPPPARYQRHKTSGYAEPAPVEEPLDSDLDYNYAPPSYANLKSARAPAHTLEAPEESSLDTPYPYDYGSSSSSNGFRPSPELHSSPGAYEDEVDAYAAPARRRRPGPVAEWPSHTGYNSAAAETYSGADSYSAGHVQGVGSGSSGSSGYQYPGPYL